MLRELINKFFALYQRVIGELKGWAKETSFPGFFNIPLWDVLIFLIEELKKEDILTRSSAMAYSFFVSLFPAIIFLFTLLPYIPVDDFELVLENTIRDVMPNSAHAFLLEAVDGIMSLPHGGLLSLGFILALFFASNGLATMMRGFEKSYSVSFKSRSFIRKRTIALLLTVFVGIMVLVSGAIIIAGNWLLGLVFDTEESEGAIYYLIGFIKWLSVFILYYGVIGVMYKFGPPLKRKFGLFSPGTTLATLFCLVTSVGFSWIMDNFGNQSQIYGSLGALIAMMIWLQLNCFILLAGFELNASIAVNRDKVLGQ